MNITFQILFSVFSSMDMLAMGTRIHQLEKENQELRAALAAYQSNKQSVRSTSTQTNLNIHVENFSVETVSNSKIKNLFSYYTGITYLRFLMLISFLFPNGNHSDVNHVTKTEKR